LNSPLLKNRCVKCHGPLQQNGKLNLSVPAGIARGGAGGPVVVPGQPHNSRLWQLVERDEMPEGAPLSASEKDLLERWIAAGAPGSPRTGDTANASETHWAFRRLQRPELPAVRQRDVLRQSFDWTPNESCAWIQATFDLVENKVQVGPAKRIGYNIAIHDFDGSSPWRRLDVARCSSTVCCGRAAIQPHSWGVCM
jgi:hypothetical protein